MFSILNKGESSLDYLVAEVGPLIPAGRAYRRAVDNRDRAREHNHAKGVKPAKHQKVVPLDQTIRAGQRLIIAGLLQSYAQKGKVIKRADEYGAVFFSVPEHHEHTG